MDNKNTITTNENIEIYENEIMIHVNDYINSLDDPARIYNNKGLITDMLKYVNRVYITGLLNNNKKNGNRYDNIQLLDYLFNIYTSIIYRYSDNIRPTILQFSLFCGVMRSTFNNWINNNTRELTQNELDTVKNWFNECELALVNDEGIKSIFLLKANFNYNDNIQSRPDENIKSISADQLPLLGENTDIM